MVIAERRLGDLEDEPGGLQPGGVQDGEDVAGEVRLLQLPAGDVDTDPAQPAALPLGDGDRPAGVVERLQAQLDDEAGLLGQRAEFVRADPALGRVVPPHQGLGRHHLLAGQLDDRLVEHDELAAVRGPPASRARSRSAGPGVQLVSPGLLGPVQRGVRATEQARGGFAGLPPVDAGGGRHPVRQRCRSQALHGAGSGLDVQVGQQDQERAAAVVRKHRAGRSRRCHSLPTDSST